MALPVTIAGSVGVSSRNSYHGPFKSSGGGFYAVVRTATVIEVHKADADDPTDAFTEQDDANAPSTLVAPASINALQDGDFLHVTWQVPATVDNVYYARFDMSDDTWQDVDGVGNTEVLIDDAPNGAQDACDIAVLSASYGVGGTHVKIRVVYQGQTAMDMGSDFDRIDESNSVDDGENWSTPTSIDSATDGAGTLYTGPRIVLPPDNSDQCIIFFKNANTDLIKLRAIAGDDTLRTYRNTGFSTTAIGSIYALTHGIGFVRSSTSKVRIGFINDDSDLTVYEIDAFSGDTDPTSGDSISIVSTDNVQLDNSSINACLAADGSIIRGLMVKATGDDLFEFDDGDSDTYTLQGTAHLVGTINHISCNVYERSGTKLAMIYDDGGTVKYDEISIGAAAATPKGPLGHPLHGPFGGPI